MAKKVQFTTNQPSATTDYLAADNTWKTMSGGGGGSGTVTSVAVTVPSALSVSGSPITTSGTIAISGAGTSSQYVKGDGTLGTTPTSLPPSGTAGGDLNGTYPNPTVDGIHGVDMQSGTPSADEVWVYGGSPAKWQHQKLHASQTTNDSTVTGTNVDDALDHLDSTKQATITGAASTVVSSNLTPSRVVVSNGGGKLDVAVTTTTEIGYVNGVTSDIQTQLNSKQGTITLTTTGSNGASTLVGSTLNIPQYSALGILAGVYGGSALTAGQTTIGTFENIGGLALGSENLRKIPIPTSCNLSKFYTITNTTQPSSGSLTLTIRKNNADTALVITIAANSVAGTYSNTTNSIAFAAGDAVTVKFVNNAGTTSASIISLSVLLS